jgi:hypothetical protein
MLPIVGRLRCAVHAIHHSRDKHVGVGHRLELLGALTTMTEGYRRGCIRGISAHPPFYRGVRLIRGIVTARSTEQISCTEED